MGGKRSDSLMLADQRRTLIAEEIRRRGAVRVSELTARLGVSDMTIRRDLDALAARELVEPGQAIALGAGTTTWRLAHHLLDVPDLTVVTNSIQVATVLHRVPRPGLTVVLTGGVRTPSDALVGPVAVSSLRSLHVDVLFTGVHGMTEDAGYSTPNLLEAETNWALISSAQRVVVIADHTKWGVRGLSRFASLDEADVLISDSGLEPEARAVLADHVDQLVVAPVRNRRRPPQA